MKDVGRIFGNSHSAKNDHGISFVLGRNHVLQMHNQSQFRMEALKFPMKQMEVDIKVRYIEYSERAEFDVQRANCGDMQIVFIDL